MGQRLVTTARRTLGYNAWLKGELPRATQLVAAAVAAAVAEGDRLVLARTLALAGALAQARGQLAYWPYSPLAGSRLQGHVDRDG